MTHSIQDLLGHARSGLERLTPEQADAAMQAGTGALIDVRPDDQRAREGEIPGSWIVPRNVLEWRFACAEGARDPRLPDHDGQPIVLCGQGYCSSLIAATLRHLGFVHATDVIGGFEGWLAAGLPTGPMGTVGATRAVAGGPDNPLPGTYA